MATYSSSAPNQRSHQVTFGDCGNHRSSPPQPILAPARPVQEQCDHLSQEPVFNGGSLTSSGLHCILPCEEPLQTELDQDDETLQPENAVPAVLPDNSMSPIEQVCHFEGLEVNGIVTRTDETMC